MYLYNQNIYFLLKTDIFFYQNQRYLFLKMVDPQVFHFLSYFNILSILAYSTTQVNFTRMTCVYKNRFTNLVLEI